LEGGRSHPSHKLASGSIPSKASQKGRFSSFAQHRRVLHNAG
jgi:hypothetical protein